MLDAAKKTGFTLRRRRFFFSMLLVPEKAGSHPDPPVERDLSKTLPFTQFRRLPVARIRLRADHARVRRRQALGIHSQELTDKGVFRRSRALCVDSWNPRAPCACLRRAGRSPADSETARYGLKFFNGLGDMPHRGRTHGRGPHRSTGEFPGDPIRPIIALQTPKLLKC